MPSLKYTSALRRPRTPSMTSAKFRSESSVLRA